jgi:hypothetical protein
VPLRPPAPSAARFVQIMVPTWDGPCRAFIGQPSLKARRRRVLSTQLAPTMMGIVSGLKTGGNALLRNVCFMIRFEKKWHRIRGARWTLNQRVPGSSPGAPTIDLAKTKLVTCVAGSLSICCQFFEHLLCELLHTCLAERRYNALVSLFPFKERA